MIPDSIVLIGAGGNGSWLALFLTQYMFHERGLIKRRFLVVDHDRFEDKNRARQFFARPGNKANSLVGTYTMRFEGRLQGLEAIPKMVVSRTDHNRIHGVETVPVSDVVKESSLIFLCVDAYYPRSVVSEYAQSLRNVCVVNGGTNKLDWDVSIHIRRGGKDITPSLLTLHPEISELAKAERGVLLNGTINRNEASCSAATDEGAEQTLASNISTATLMFQVFIAYLADKITAYSFEGAVYANQNGLWGPSLRSISDALV
ncbi:MAG: ThiF family adenylyltransferase [Candidatus Woesebacteria bacterium]|nr:MAG: ThiF family adenylyltransferase [Candidatus Woesebacteria bacterium]